MKICVLLLETNAAKGKETVAILDAFEADISTGLLKAAFSHADSFCNSSTFTADTSGESALLLHFVPSTWGQSDVLVSYRCCLEILNSF